MSYFLFLAIFLGIPILFLSILTVWDRRRGQKLPTGLRNLPAWGVILVHVLVAVIYTTPWDNYLVATGVWYYNPALVSGITLGWVPVEEYTFFVVQTIMTGLWLLFLARRIGDPSPALPPAASSRLRSRATMILGGLWLMFAGVLLLSWQPGIYLSLILVWAIPPIMLQILFGADLLWNRRKLVALAMVSVTTYLGLADSLAIGSGTWTIDPTQSLNLFLGTLPVEELVFFFVTNVLIVFGSILALDCESRARGQALMRFIRTGLHSPKEQTMGSTE